MNEIEQFAADEAAKAVAPEAGEADTQEAPDPAEIEAEARRLGWKPREEWKGDATNWTAAPAYLEYARSTPHKLKRIEQDFTDRLARIEAFNADVLKREREKHAAELEEARKAQRDAVAVADPDAWEVARKREDALRASAPAQEAKPAAPELPAETREWAARNSWFETDPEMKRAAVALAQKAADAGLPVTGQLAYVDREIASLFPDRVKPAAPAARTFAAVDSGMVSAPNRRAKGWADIPAAEREMIKKHHIGVVYKDEAEAAKSYWEAN